MEEIINEKDIRLRIITFFTLSLIVTIKTTIYAVPASPEPASFEQPNGKVIEILIKGDEFLNWSEDSEGNLIIFDESKKGFCYGLWSDEGVVSTGTLVGDTVVGRASPQKVKGGNIPKKVRERALEARKEIRPFEDVIQISPLSVGASNVPVVSDAEALKRKLLIIHVRWEDESNIQPTP